MAESINWIHFTDLHFGLDRESWLWPTVRQRVLQDLESTTERFAGCDLVFFTGDLVQSGAAAEYDALNRELEKIWRVLSKRGKDPLLCVVPGNHDLLRPPSGSPIAKTLVHVWPEDEELQRQFWAVRESEYRSALDKFFANYSTWRSSVSVPIVPLTAGTLPGDFSATYHKGNVRLGIVGLNSTFLQIDKGNFKEKLAIHVSQVNSVCNGDPQHWLAEQSASVLLMHHPPSWLSPVSRQHYRQEIYPSGRFIAHLCGHLHEPEHFETSEAGAAPRRLRQGPSLFGLAEWQGVEPIKRTHGYNAGQFVFEADDGLEKLWPKISLTGRDGALNIAPDYTYNLKDECVVTAFDLNTDAKAGIGSVEADAKETPQLVKAPAAQSLSLLDSEPTEAIARSSLVAAPRFTLAPAPHYRATRQDEQSQFEHELRRSRQVWIAAEWGTGLEGFLAAGLDRLSDLAAAADVFLLRCDELEDVNALEASFLQQFGYPLHVLSTLLAALPCCFLILDGLQPSICAGEGLIGLQRIVNLITEYCPKLRLIITSNAPPNPSAFVPIQLRPLELPEVRVYLLHHPDASAETREPDPDLIETLHERSDGLPTHLDRLIKAMKVASPEAVLEADLETSITQQEPDELTPRALVHAVNTLLTSEDRSSRRNLKLLHVLTLLPYGETLDTLRHYLPTEPFFPENAIKLQELGLIDVIRLQQTAPQLGSSENRAADSAPKLLKVRRPVRDHVLTLLSETEKEEIVLAGIEKVFGRNWRFKVKLRKLPIEHREYLNAGAGNEFALIHQLAIIARAKGDNAVVSRVAKLGIQYAEHPESSERWHDLAVAGGALLQLLDRDRHREEWARLTGLYGGALRMSDKKQESLTYLRAALEAGEAQFSAADRAEIWMEIALVDKDEDPAAATAAARHALEYAKKDSATHVHAEALIAELNLSGKARIDALDEIEKRARGKGQEGIANSVALNLYQLVDDPKDELRYLNRVLETEDPGYTRIRALINKAEALTRLPKQDVLKGAELAELTKAYSYLHAQRFGSLFDRCHEMLWDTFEAQGDTQRLLRLFRHSSFLWRLRGRDEQESAYLKRLSETKLQEQPPAKTMVIEFSYFLRRLRIILQIN